MGKIHFVKQKIIFLLLIFIDFAFIDIIYSIFFTIIGIIGIKALEFEIWAKRYYLYNCYFYVVYVIGHIIVILHGIITFKSEI